MAEAKRIPVLMYHRVGTAHNDWERRYCISPKLFSQHMHHLAKQGMQACTLSDFFAWLSGDLNLPEGSFLLTFDDGFLGVYEHAVPVLQQIGWTATIFLVSQLIGKDDKWCQSHNPSGATYPLLAQEHIQAMRKDGFTFHSHTRLHPDLTSLGDSELRAELSGSRQDLNEILDGQVDYIAYPYGLYDERVKSATHDAGYQAAFSTQPGFNRRGIDPYRIRRLDIFGTDTPVMLARKIHFGSNDGTWKQTFRYYSQRLLDRLGH